MRDFALRGSAEDDTDLRDGWSHGIVKFELRFRDLVQFKVLLRTSAICVTAPPACTAFGMTIPDDLECVLE